MVSAAVNGCSVNAPVLLTFPPNSTRSDVSVTDPLPDEIFAEVLML
jgi:hypothetical protein